MEFASASKYSLFAYGFLFCIGAPGNLFVFISIGRQIFFRGQWNRSRIKVLIWHLAIADLLVTFVVIPVEVIWRLTIAWYGGEVLCKLTQFFRAFGLYLSSTIIICISMDRFLAVVFPLRTTGRMTRVRNMLTVAWTTSILFALPQIVVFNVHHHPRYPSFPICSNANYFSLSKEIMYNLLSLSIMYFVPLVIIIVTYTTVLYAVTRTNVLHQNCRPHGGNDQLQRNDNPSNIARVRKNALWLSMIIVTIFVLCWTPFVSTTLWYMIDFESADKVIGPQLQDAFFVTAVSSSCLNPIIYGNYMKKYWRRLVSCTCWKRHSRETYNSSPSASHRTRHRESDAAGCLHLNHEFSMMPHFQLQPASVDSIELPGFHATQLARQTISIAAETTCENSPLFSARHIGFSV